MARLLFACVIAVAIGTLPIACGSTSVTTPRYVSQPQEALEEVPFPPPPARVEFIPRRPSDDAVWIDGEWVWHGRRYAWKPGRWVKPPARGAYAPWTTVRDAMGTLYLAKGTWRDESGAALPDPEPLATGSPTRASVVDPEGEEIVEGPEQNVNDATPPPRPADASIVSDAPVGVPDALDLPRDATPLDARTTMTSP